METIMKYLVYDDLNILMIIIINMVLKTDVIQPNMLNRLNEDLRRNTGLFSFKT